MNLPLEVVYKILDYRYELLWKEGINKCKEEILFTSAMWICNYYGIDYGSEMPDEIDKNEVIKIYEKLYNCNCCKSHRFCKPSTQLFESGFCPPFDYYDDDENPKDDPYNEYSRMLPKKNDFCICKCKEHCEMLCREYNDDYCDNDELQIKLKNKLFINLN